MLSRGWNLLAIRFRELLKRLRSRASRESPRARLVRQRLAEVGPKFTLQLSGASGRETDACGSRHAAIALSSWESKGSYRLDARRTIRATLERGGLFRPVWYPLRRAAEYVFLIQGLGPLDMEQTRLLQLTGELRKAGVPLACYFYLTDPRQLREPSPAGDGTFRNLDLARVAERHPHGRLVIFSTGHEFFHPLTLSAMSWTSALLRWPKRALLTPVPQADWTHVESLLRKELGFLIGSARPQGLLDLAVDLNPGGQAQKRRDSGEVGAGDLVDPAILRYVSDVAPPELECAGLIERIQAYLGGRGFEWLALCACYPELNLDLTVYLRRFLEAGREDATGTSRESDEDLLARLVSLCWFRHGFLPVWLRRRIMASLPRRRRLALWQAVAEMLAGARLAEGAGKDVAPPTTAEQSSVRLPIWERRDPAGQGWDFDAVTIDFLIDGPTHDIDPLINVVRTEESTSERQVAPSVQELDDAPAPSDTQRARQEHPSPIQEPRTAQGRGQEDAGRSSGNLCFILMPSGRKTDPAGRVTNLDSVYRDIIAPAVEQAGLEPARSDEPAIGGTTFNKSTLDRLLSCNYLLADLTGSDPMVYYQLGVRHALRPTGTILLFAAGTVVPFDVALVRGVPYRTDGAGEPIDAEAAVNSVAEQLRFARENPRSDSPIFQLLDDLPQVEIDHLQSDLVQAQIDYSKRYKERIAIAVREGAQAVENIAAEPALGNLNDVEGGVVVDLYLAMRDVKAYQSMIALYQRMPPSLQRAKMMREQLGLAFARDGRF
jgi:hypothetical protein